MEKIAALEDAIEKRSLVGIYSVFYTIVHGDPNFSTGKFREVLEYVKSKNMEGFMQEYDGEEFEPEEKWNEDYWALIASSLVDNFCMERIEHLEKVGRKVYPVKTAHPMNATQTKEKINLNAKCSTAINSNRRQRSGHTTRSITEERKKGVKFDHANRIGKDDGGFLKKLFGPRSGR